MLGDINGPCNSLVVVEIIALKNTATTKRHKKIDHCKNCCLLAGLNAYKKVVDWYVTMYGNYPKRFWVLALNLVLADPSPPMTDKFRDKNFYGYITDAKRNRCLSA